MKICRSCREIKALEFKQKLGDGYRCVCKGCRDIVRHIDHIKPLALFDLTDPEHVKVACQYTNIQPLWWYDNLNKGAKYDIN